MLMLQSLIYNISIIKFLFSNPSIAFQTKEVLLGKIDVNIILLSLNRSFSRLVFSPWLI